ncbi:L,D-transpeptidase, partial [Sodalis-like symbiont of Bactericera trigonica]
LARDKILSDAMLGYLQFTNGVGANGERWLYGNTTYPLTLPPRELNERWQNALNDGRLDGFVSGPGAAASPIPENASGVESYSGRQSSLAAALTGSASLRPGQFSDDIPALREILQRTGMLHPGG